MLIAHLLNNYILESVLSFLLTVWLESVYFLFISYYLHYVNISVRMRNWMTSHWSSVWEEELQNLRPNWHYYERVWLVTVSCFSFEVFNYRSLSVSFCPLSLSLSLVCVCVCVCARAHVFVEHNDSKTLWYLWMLPWWRGMTDI